MDRAGTTPSTRAPVRDLVTFVALATAFTWLAWLPLLLEHLTGADLPTLPLQFFLASFGPAFAAVIVAARGGRTALRAWWHRVSAVRGRGRQLVAVAAMVAGYLLLGQGTAAALTGDWPAWSRLGLTEKLPGWPVAAVLAVWLLSYGLGEELGWRGWLLPALRTRSGRVRAVLMTTAAWAAWHLPAFWFNPTYTTMGWAVLGWLVGLLAGSFLLAEITESAGWSVVPVVVWHGGFDLITASDQAAGTMAAVVSTVVMAQGGLAWWRMRRRDRGR